MQIKHSETVNAPIDYVFARATDFARFERMSEQEGVKFKRVGRSPIRIGTRWDIAVPYKGRSRKFRGELSQFVAPGLVSYRSTSRKYQAALSLSFTPLSAGTCRMEMLLVAQSRSFATSLVFNAIRIGRKPINRKIRARMKAAAETIASDYRTTDT